MEELQATIPAPYKRGRGDHGLGRSPPTPKSPRLLPTNTHSTSSSTKTHLRSMPPPPRAALPRSPTPVPARLVASLPGLGVTRPRSLALLGREGEEKAGQGGAAEGRRGGQGRERTRGRTQPPPRTLRAGKSRAEKSRVRGGCASRQGALGYRGGGGGL